jgi:hypothetical protein
VIVRDDVAEPVRMDKPSLVIRSVMGPAGGVIVDKDILAASLCPMA